MAKAWDGEWQISWRRHLDFQVPRRQLQSPASGPD
jgi:hypothetical protein